MVRSHSQVKFILAVWRILRSRGFNPLPPRTTVPPNTTTTETPIDSKLNLSGDLRSHTPARVYGDLFVVLLFSHSLLPVITRVGVLKETCRESFQREVSQANSR